LPAVIFAALSTPGAALANSAPRNAREAVDEARATVSQMALRSERIFKLLREARNEGDDKKAQCIDDVLSQAHALERRGEAEAEGIAQAAKSGDDDTVEWRSKRLRVLSNQSIDLVTHASRCGKK
jgi:hypothetical protein